MYNSGADIVYHAAGNTGTGVFQAAEEQEGFAIGVDRDQSITRPDYADVILGSMVKRVDTAVYNAIEATIDDELPGGSNVALGLDNEGVALVYGDQIGSEIPEDVKDEVSTAREEIIAGDISVPSEV
jgi:basic membrane protein A